MSNPSYDLNGNMTSGSGVTLTYDGSNWVASSTPIFGGTEYYGYGADNKRVWRRPSDGVEEWTLYGARGEKIGVYQWNLYQELDGNGNWIGDYAQLASSRTSLWFDGKLIAEAGQPVMADRLATNKATGARYYPYGEEITSTANDRVKFATYNRDGLTGLDYADQRYYASTYGRFNSPDPYKASGGTNDPGSWNRYSYVGDDPVNFADPSGLTKCDPNGDNCYDSVTVTDAPTGFDFPLFVGLGASGKPRPNSEGKWDLLPLRYVEQGQRLPYLHAVALQLASEVQSNSAYTNCDALADYATIADDGNARDLDRAFSNLTPSQAASNVAGILSTSQPVFLYAGGSNGFAQHYQNTIPDGGVGSPNNGDQGHHFAAFFQVGFQYGASAGAILAGLFEAGETALGGLNGNYGPLNQGDIALGIAAAQIGSDLRSGTITTSQVGGRIRSLCGN